MCRGRAERSAFWTPPSFALLMGGAPASLVGWLAHSGSEQKHVDVEGGTRIVMAGKIRWLLLFCGIDSAVAWILTNMGSVRVGPAVSILCLKLAGLSTAVEDARRHLPSPACPGRSNMLAKTEVRCANFEPWSINSLLKGIHFATGWNTHQWQTTAIYFHTEQKFFRK